MNAEQVERHQVVTEGAKHVLTDTPLTDADRNEIIDAAYVLRGRLIERPVAVKVPFFRRVMHRLRGH
jgi:hypothetical protein